MSLLYLILYIHMASAPYDFMRVVTGATTNMYKLSYSFFFQFIGCKCKWFYSYMQGKTKNFYKKMKFSFICFVNRDKITKFNSVNA